MYCADGESECRIAMVIMMKTNRKIIAVLLIIVLGLLNNIHTVKASYEPITPSESFDINAKLYIHQLSDMNEKTYTYSYSVDSNPHVYVHGNVTYGTDSGVNGAPTMTNSVTFSSSDFSADKQEFGLFYASKNLTVSLADMTFREPGIYYWKGTKTCSSSNYVTNNHSVFYIIVFVEDHEGVLQIVNKKVVAGADGTTVDVPDATGKLDAFMDEMVTTFHNLNVKKEVTGRLAKTTDAFFVVNDRFFLRHGNGLYRANIGTNTTAHALRCFERRLLCHNCPHDSSDKTSL